MNTKDIMTKYGEWIRWALVMLMVTAQLYLTSTFVTLKRYEVDIRDNAQQHLQIQTSIADIAVTLKLMAAAQTRLEDHEARIRVMEQKQSDVTARLAMLERMK